MDSAPRHDRPSSGPAVWATLGVRGFGLVMVVFGAWQLIARVAEQAGTLDAAYWADFAMVRLAAPAVALLCGMLLLLSSRPLGRLLARRLDD
jgi:hypothetical protein